nr:hypothetical protein [Tanacetum cinerariifolium]
MKGSRATPLAGLRGNTIVGVPLLGERARVEGRQPLVRQKNTLAEYMILSGADNRPPMLDNDLVSKDLWERIQLLMQGEGYMARQCPKPKKRKDATWFRDKVLLVKAQGNGKVINEEELGFLEDLGITEGPVAQTVITHNAAYQADDLDAYNSDCDDFSTATTILMANLSSYRSNVLSEVPHSENTHTDMLNQSVQDMSYFEQTYLVNYPENEITSDSNIILYSQYLLETQNTAIQDTKSSTQQDSMILSVFEKLSNQVTEWDNLIANESLSAELER